MDARGMKRIGLAALGAVGLGLAGWGAALALQNNQTGAGNASADEAAPPEAQARPQPRAQAPTQPQPQPVRGVTPMAEREAVIGLLNKRNGLSRDLRMKPGQALRVGDVIVRLRACEQTAPWEPEQLTGAFVQLDIRGADDHWKRIFSGWLYKELPSLNMVEHPIYDVWAKACTMRFPDIGPDTEQVASGATSQSSARRSGGGGAAAEPVEPPPAVPTANAESSNAT